MATTDVALSSDSVSPSGTVKNGTIVTQALNTGSYVTNDCTNCNPTAVSGLTDDAIEALYENRFDDTSYYTV
tara:strand:+ start:249 stop:464 length:216 start_codon:yes stop_codon:yes gene_type:complete